MSGASSPAGGQPAGHIQETLRDGIATLTISNPARRNAMTLAMWRQLAASLARLREAPDLRVLALTGAGSQAFVSGADISEFDQARDSAEAAAVYNQAVAEAQDALARFPAPTVALIQGACMGGGIGLALACDLRYASASARFRMPAARLGLGYGYADMRRVVAVTGMAAAFELFYTARTLDAEQAQAGGLLHERFALDDFEQISQARLQRIAANAPLSLRAAKAAILASTREPSAAELEAIAALVRQCFDSADYAEGRRAFAERRDPVFTGL
ncbi:enoyl-CoA hydratase/isomerase family protein [Achromobacter sp. Marseille-Q0513]|uniref:enoyl-CoA hydratase n=1 Tax=Achromobacter sp. Marseille-Q0513 TaxID=2829161 RepID=UPI001B8DF1F9|nr:enoyl-CoA hydratase [Achromobacter sp. Marseille-Q0513]MBR8653067.1 enoyl-CoA hydratase/isomerase family protein [Achromobacter sp. Marseille-Q0513]